jgi:hypothetical protein
MQHRFAKTEVQEDSLEKICSVITHRIYDEEKGHMDQTITYTELAEAMKQAPKRKSPGEDGIAAELYERGREIMSDLTQLYNNFFHSGTVPSIDDRHHSLPSETQQTGKSNGLSTTNLTQCRPQNIYTYISQSIKTNTEGHYTRHPIQRRARTKYHRCNYGAT